MNGPAMWGRMLLHLTDEARLAVAIPLSCIKGMLTVLAALVAADATALEADHKQPIHIEADSAMIEEKKGSSVYRGDVTIDQGTMHISAHQVEIITDRDDRDKVIQIIASADNEPDAPLAHYEQQPNPDEDKVYADARKITYFVQEERVHLTGNARLKQLRDTFAGDLLYYNVNEGVLNLDSSGQEGDRVIMTINPEDK